MAVSDTVANIFGGFTIFTDRPFTTHDSIRISGFDRSVEGIGIRITSMRTLDGTLVTIPNFSFSDFAVENVTAEPSRKVVRKLGLTYDADAAGKQQTIDLLPEINGANEGVKDKVLTAFTEYGDFSMKVLFIYYI